MQSNFITELVILALFFFVTYKEQNPTTRLFAPVDSSAVTT